MASKPIPDFARDLFDPSARERLLSCIEATPSAARAFSAPDLKERPYPRVLVEFVKAGGRLVLGSDAGAGARIPGLANHEALENLVRIGFSPIDAIRIATLNGATFLGIQNRGWQ